MLEEVAKRLPTEAMLWRLSVRLGVETHVTKVHPNTANPVALKGLYPSNLSSLEPVNVFFCKRCVFKFVETELVQEV